MASDGRTRTDGRTTTELFRSPPTCHPRISQLADLSALPHEGVPPTVTSSRRSTALNEFLTPEERADKIQRWGEIRTMTKEEAAADLSGEELETYNNYYTEVREGVLKMQELAQIMMKDVDKAQGKEPKTKGQRKRDAWARKQKRAAANAAAYVQP